MYDGIVAAIDCHMAAVADDISRLRFCQAYFISHASHGAGRMRKRLTKMSVYTHDITGAVSAVGEAGAAPAVRIAHKL